MTLVWARFLLLYEKISYSQSFSTSNLKLSICALSFTEKVRRTWIVREEKTDYAWLCFQEKNDFSKKLCHCAIIDSIQVRNNMQLNISIYMNTAINSVPKRDRCWKPGMLMASLEHSDLRRFASWMIDIRGLQGKIKKPRLGARQIWCFFVFVTQLAVIYALNKNAVLLKEDRYLLTRLFTALHCFSHQLFRSKFGTRSRVD